MLSGHDVILILDSDNGGLLELQKFGRRGTKVGW